MKGWTAVVGISAILVGASACSDSAAGGDPESQPEREARPTTDAAWDSLREPGWVTLIEFEGGYDIERGGWFFDTLEPGTLAIREEAMPGLFDEEALHTVRMPQWCAASISTQLTPGTVRIFTVPDTLELSGVGEPIPASCDIPPAEAFLYESFGMLCSDQRVVNNYDVMLPDVHVQLLSFAGNQALNGAFLFPFGTGVLPPSGRNAPTNTYGLWSYGDIAPGANTTVNWQFRNTGSDPFVFTGSVVYRSVEVCDDPGGLDEDCDGRVNNGCGSFPFGAPCLDDIDCATGNCTEAFVCGVSTCGNGLLDGTESDVDCGGLCPGCLVDQACVSDTDCASTWCRTSGTCAAGARPTTNSLVVSEFLANPGPALGGGTAGEYVEIFNRTALPIDLVGCELRDDGGDSHIIASSVVVPAGGFATLVNSTSNTLWTTSGITPTYQYSGFVLGNTNDQIELRCGGQVMDRVVYTSAQAVAGVAWQRSPETLVIGVPQYCRANTPVSGLPSVLATPGAANTTCSDVELACRLVHPTTSGVAVAGQPIEGHVRVFGIGYTDVTPYSNEAALPFQIEMGVSTANVSPETSPGSWTWTTASPTPSYQTRPALDGEDTNWDGYRALLGTPGTAADLYVLGRVSEDNGATWIYCDRVAGASDGSRDGLQLANTGRVTTLPPGVATPATEGQIVITEVMGNAVVGVDDVAGEWVELHNPGAAPRELRGCLLQDYTAAGAPSTATHTFDASVVVPAGGYVVVANNVWSRTNGGVNAAGWFRGGTGGIQLGNTGDIIELRCGSTLISRAELPVSLIGTPVRGRTAQFLAGAPMAQTGNRDYWCNTQDIVDNRYSAAGAPEGYGTPGAPNRSTCLNTASIGFGPGAAAPATTSLPVADPGSTHRVVFDLTLAGLTDPAGINLSYNLRAQLGAGPTGTAVGSAGWTWTEAQPSRDLTTSITGRDLWTGYVTASTTQGAVRDVAARWSTNGGLTWTSTPVRLQLETASAGAAPDPCLLFSEYIEGSSNNKALELWNCGDTPINLADYKLCLHQQGTTSTSTICNSFYALTGTLAAGDVWVIANSGSNAQILGAADVAINATVTQFNGNDARILVRASFAGTVPTAADIIDQIGFVGWPHTNTTLADRTFRRKNCDTFPSTSSWNFADTMFQLPTDTVGAHPTSGADELGTPPDFTCGSAATGDPGVRRPAPGDLVITEVMVNTGLATRRWLEVQNTSAFPVDLGGLRLRDTGRFEYDRFIVRSDAGTLAPGAHAVLAGSNTAVPGTPLDRWNWSEFAFTLTGTDSVVVDVEGTVLTTLAWSSTTWPWDVDTTMALSADATGASVTDVASWCLGTGAYAISGTPYVGTPGAANEVCPPPPGGPITRAPVPGDLIFSEFMPDTAEGGTDTLYEWFEVHNRSSDNIDLAGVYFRELPSGAGFFVDVPLVVPAGGYAVMARSEAAFEASTPPVTTTVPGVLFYYPNGIQLANGGETLGMFVDDTQSVELDRINFTAGSGGTGFFGTLASSPYAGRSVALRPAFLTADQPTRQTDTGAWCLTDATNAAFTYRFNAGATQNGGRNQGTPGAANTQCN